MLAVVVALLVAMVLRKADAVRSQAELAAFKTTLAALRTALVIDYLQDSVSPRGPVAATVRSNPFALLKGRPPNYAGELINATPETVPVGSWVFDATCLCVGYRPMVADALETPVGAPVAWFQVSRPPGPLTISPIDRYRWLGETLD